LKKIFFSTRKYAEIHIQRQFLVNEEGIQRKETSSKRPL
jgi:hypothetical protein